MAGLLIIRDGRWSLARAARREIRRVGLLKFLDVAAFRLYARVAWAKEDAAWKTAELARLRARYPSDLEDVPRLVVSSPNSPEARAFLEQLAPDLAIARCKVILSRATYEIPRAGTFVLHPGVCPEYRNAHGCFWALVNRDLARVGMTLLRVDPGIDTGPIYLQAGCEFDETRESHTMIQYRVVTENLDEVGRALLALGRGEPVVPIPTAGRASAVWGQPRLTDYLRWKRMARRMRRPVKGRPTANEAVGRGFTPRRNEVPH